MKHPRPHFFLAGLCLVSLASSILAAPSPARVLLVVGGHDYQTNDFHLLFEQNPDVTFKVVEHPNAHRWLRHDKAADYQNPNFSRLLAQAIRWAATPE
jgi:hypothetical protein